jgi:NADH dehydrogenase
MDRIAHTDRARVVVLGAGFAGYHCLRRLERRLPAGSAEIVAVTPADYMLYVPLLPDVTGGVLAPRRVAVPLRTHLPRTRLVLGTVTSLNLDERACSVVDVEGRPRVVRYDRLVITCGSVTRLLAVPGVAEHAMGFKSVAEALYLRDHILRQLELAEQCDDDAERAARLTFAVVGAGYTGTEVAAQGALLTQRALRHRPRLRGQHARWVLLDLASRVLPGLDAGLSGRPPRCCAGGVSTSGWGRR